MSMIASTVFKAGASHYGISDLETLARDTHKFESRYLDKLIGPYPERADLYRQRSPIHAVERLSCPMIFFQGLEDKIVLPNQAEMMVAALKNKGLPVAYLAYEGEQHGFRRAENIKRTLNAELYFFSRVFDFALADPVEPVTIDNLYRGDNSDRQPGMDKARPIRLVLTDCDGVLTGGGVYYSERGEELKRFLIRDGRG
jgi:acetyl esterase/lipase